MSHRSHLLAHVAIAAAVVGMVALRLVGVAVPRAVVYVVVLACPIMMISMVVMMARSDRATAIEPRPPWEPEPTLITTPLAPADRQVE